MHTTHILYVLSGGSVGRTRGWCPPDKTVPPTCPPKLTDVWKVARLKKLVKMEQSLLAS